MARKKFGAVAWYSTKEVEAIVAATIAETTDRLLNEELIKTQKEIKELKEKLTQY